MARIAARTFFEARPSSALGPLPDLTTLVLLRIADFKLDSIMIIFEDESVLEAIVQGQAAHAMARKVVDDYLYGLALPQ